MPPEPVDRPFVSAEALVKLGSFETFAAQRIYGGSRRTDLSLRRVRTQQMRDGVDGPCFNGRRNAP